MATFTLAATLPVGVRTFVVGVALNTRARSATIERTSPDQRK